MSQKSFTIIELLVVAGIIIILTTIFFTLPDYQRATSQFALERSAHKLAQDIRRTAEMAMSAEEIESPTGEKIIPTGGYGIFLRTLPNPPYYEIILFADCNDNQQYTPGDVCGTSPNQFSEKIKNLNLEEKVKISNLSPSLPLSITFKPPSPKIFIQGGATAIITLALKADSSKIKTIEVNKAGLIDVE